MSQKKKKTFPKVSNYHLFKGWVQYKLFQLHQNQNSGLQFLHEFSWSKMIPGEGDQIELVKCEYILTYINGMYKRSQS